MMKGSLDCYKVEIFDLFAKIESDEFNNSLNPVMIDNQPEIKWSIRPFLIDFLLELNMFFDLSQETLFLASSIADRYCSKRIVYKRHYQLLIATSLWIAAKYQDKKTNIPTLKELYLLCYQIYDKQMFIQMEKHILSTLNWQVTTFSLWDSLNLVNTCYKNQKTITTQLASFLLNLSIYKRNYMLFNSSTRALSAYLLAANITNDTEFLDHFKLCIRNDTIGTETETHSHFPFKIIAGDVKLHLSTDKLYDIRNCILVYLEDLFKNKPSKVIYKKFKNIPITDLLTSFTTQNIELYIHLTKMIDQIKSSKIANTYIHPTLNNNVKMFIDYFAGLKKIDYKNQVEEDILDNQLSFITKPSIISQLNESENSLNSLDLDSQLPHLMRSASTISDLTSTNTMSTVSSRSSSIFSQQNITVESPHFIDAITPTSATSKKFSNHSRMKMGSISSTSGININNNNILLESKSSSYAIPPTPTITKHKSSSSFSYPSSSIGTGNLFSDSPSMSCLPSYDSTYSFRHGYSSSSLGLNQVNKPITLKKKLKK